MTLYATLGEEAIVHGILETECAIVITSSELLPKFQVLQSVHCHGHASGLVIVVFKFFLLACLLVVSAINCTIMSLGL